MFYAFETDPELKFVDLHEDGRFLYPGTGSRSETGRGAAVGTKLNIPLPPGADDTVFLEAWQEAERYLEDAEPELILLQCGADSLGGDPITHLKLTAEAHAHAARRLARARRSLRGRSRARHGRRRLQPHESRDGVDARRRRAGGLTMFDARSLADVDAELERALAGERERQETYLELIASENYVSPRVLAAQGSLLTNKYADGYPGERHYAGCELADVAERLAIERAQRLFGAGYANVQPYSGSQANLAAYLALLSPGDTLLGMRPAHGGHRTHGAAENQSGALYNVVPYDVVGGDGRARLRADRRPRASASTEARRRRLLGVLARRRLGAVSRDRRRGRGVVPRRHRARRRAHRGRSLSEPRGNRRRHDDDDAQDAARPARRHDPRAAAFGADASASTRPCSPARRAAR